MLKQIKTVGVIAVIGVIAYSLFSESKQSADLAQVLDRTEYAMSRYQKHLDSQNIDAATDEEIDQFKTVYADVLNAQPRFYDDSLGVSIGEDAKFVGYADKNANGTQDSGEQDVFTVEIDEANNRLIASDPSGNSSGLQFSGAGFLAGALMGHFLGRQRSAGIKPGSFNNRNVTPRNAYRAPSSARSGGPRAGK